MPLSAIVSRVVMFSICTSSCGHLAVFRLSLIREHLFDVLQYLFSVSGRIWVDLGYSSRAEDVFVDRGQ